MKRFLIVLVLALFCFSGLSTVVASPWSPKPKVTKKTTKKPVDDSKRKKGKKVDPGPGQKPAK